jgi:hypothetical protein
MVFVAVVDRCLARLAGTGWTGEASTWEAARFCDRVFGIIRSGTIATVEDDSSHGRFCCKIVVCLRVEPTSVACEVERQICQSRG